MSDDLDDVIPDHEDPPYRCDALLPRPLDHRGGDAYDDLVDFDE